jgi:hypothetical protein
LINNNKNRNMRTNYNDSSNRNNGRYPKRQNGGSGGGSGGGRRPSGGGGGHGRKSPGQHSGGGQPNVSAMTSTRNKYLEMAKEALSNGNRVEAENYYQHAEHYSKMLNAAMVTKRERDEQQAQQHPRRNHNNQGGNPAENTQNRQAEPQALDEAPTPDNI